MTDTTKSLKRKATTIEFVEAKAPTPAADFLELFRVNSAARSDSANTWIIDVFPNMTSILMYCMLTAIHHAQETECRKHSKSSVATICMYYMTVVYGFFLLNDAFVRPTPSAHARSWREISWKNDFLQTLFELNVPEFLEPILSQFSSFETERTKNVFFVPSATGYDHDQFFGRVYPINMFAAIHDCTATLPGNSSKIDVLKDLYSRVLYSITAPAFQCLIPDLIGVTIAQATDTTANYMNSKLYQVFTAFINPVLFRDFQHRSSLAALSFGAPTFETNHVNAYDLLFSASPANIRELKVVLQAIDATLKDKVKSKNTLRTFIETTSNASILKHAYSTYALPTWSHSTNANKSTTFAGVTTHTLVTEEARAQDFSFLQRPNAALTHTEQVLDVTYVADADRTTPIPLPANHQLIRHFPYSLRANEETVLPFPGHDDRSLVQFSDEANTYPSVLVLDTDGDGILTAYMATISGKIIESFELDGSTIEMPNADKALSMQNCMFADSAIPYKYVRPGSSYHPVVARSVMPPLARATPNSRPRLPASSLLHDRTKVMLPLFNPTSNPRADLATLPGMTERRGVIIPRYAQSFIGLRTVDSSANTAALDNVPAMPEGDLLLWSPYTYSPFESPDYPFPNHGDSRHYYLTNLRTIFGTDFNLIQARHPYEAMPIV